MNATWAYVGIAMFALLVFWLAWRIPKRPGKSVKPEVWLERQRLAIGTSADPATPAEPQNVAAYWIMLHIANHGRDALRVGNVVLTDQGKPLRVEPDIRDGPLVVTQQSPARVYLGSSTDVLNAARQRRLVCELSSPGGKRLWRGRVPDRTGRK